MVAEKTECNLHIVDISYILIYNTSQISSIAWTTNKTRPERSSGLESAQINQLLEKSKSHMHQSIILWKPVTQGKAYTTNSKSVETYIEIRKQKWSITILYINIWKLYFSIGRPRLQRKPQYFWRQTITLSINHSKNAWL